MTVIPGYCQVNGGRYTNTPTNLENTARGSMPERTLEARQRTLVYWNVSFLPVNVASIECGAVSISHIPGAAQTAVHKCSCLWFTLGSDIVISPSHAPAEMDRPRVKTMHVVLICTQAFAQMTLDRTKSGIALMEGMIVAASNMHELMKFIERLIEKKRLPWDSACPRTRI